MGGVKIGPKKYFLAGGLSSTRQIIAKDSYIYNLETNKVDIVAEMIDRRYTFPMSYIPPYVYAIGGRNYGTNEVAIMRSCERFNLETHKWERISSIQHRRCSSHSIVFNNEIYIMGGFQIPKKRVAIIEKYDCT